MITVATLSHLLDLSRVYVVGEVLALCPLSSFYHVLPSLAAGGVTASLGSAWCRVGAQYTEGGRMLLLSLPGRSCTTDLTKAKQKCIYREERC